MKELRGTHAVLTGASRGLGAVVADALAARGVHLTLAARSAEGLERVREQVVGRGVRALAVPTDVADAADRARLVATAVRELGPIDILVNNAGIESLARFADAGPDEVERLVTVNLTAPLLLTQLVLPGMVARRTGHVVNMASLAGKSGAPFEAVYSATKAGLVGASQALRAELAGTGVSVSAVCPGFVAREGMYARHVTEGGIEAPPRLRVTTPEKVAEAVLRAVERDAAELLVTPGPLRPLLALGELLPSLRAPMTNWMVARVLRAAADIGRQPAGTAPPPP